MRAGVGLCRVRPSRCVTGSRNPEPCEAATFSRRIWRQSKWVVTCHNSGKSSSVSYTLSKDEDVTVTRSLPGWRFGVMLVAWWVMQGEGHREGLQAVSLCLSCLHTGVGWGDGRPRAPSAAP